MKYLVLLMAALLSTSVHANEALGTPVASSFDWKASQELMLRCAVQPYATRGNGERVFGVLRTVCPELQVVGSVARFKLAGVSFTAELYDSRFSDGGDLNDLFVKDAQGRVVAYATHLPAFGDVILALAGGDDSFPLVHDDSVLSAFVAESEPGISPAP